MTRSELIRPRRIRLVAACLLLSCLEIVLAAPASADANSWNWRVERGTYQCSLTNTKGPKFELELSDSFAAATLFAMRSSSNDFATRPSELVLLPSGASFRSESEGMWIPGGFAVFGLPGEFLDQFSRSTRLIVNIDGKKKFDFAFDATPDAVRTLRACHSMLLRSWGVEPPEVSASIKQPQPLENRSSWFDKKEVDKVVTEAMAIHGGGSAVVAFTVLPSGSVKDCRTVVSSGRPALDSLTCYSISKHAHFEPASDASGKPIAVRMAYVQHWAFSRP